MVLHADLTIAAASDAYLAATKTTRAGIIGRFVFDVFPDNPDAADVNAVNNSRASFERVLRTGIPDEMPVQRHDVRNASGVFEPKYWKPLNSPLFDNAGRVSHILHCAEDVTEVHDLNERQNLEIARLRLTAIVESSDDAILSQSLDGNILSWNRGAERIFGYTAEEAVGKPLMLLIPPDKVEEEWEILEHVRRGENVEHIETVRVTKSGTRLDVSVTISPMRDTTGKVVAASKVCRDITERKRTEEAIRGALSNIKALERALDAHALVSITDRLGTIIFVNDMFCDVSKYSREELLGQNHRIIKSTHHPASFFSDMWATITSGEIWKGEIKNRAKDGSYYWVATTIVPFLDAGGTPYQFVAIRTDITARVLADEARKKSEAALLEAQHTAKVGSWELDFATNLWTWSGEIYSIFGREMTSALVAGDTQQYFSVEEWSRIQAMVEEARMTGMPFELDCQIRRSDGERRWISVRGGAVRDASRKIVKLRGTLQDITERKEAEDQVRTLNANLEQRVMERTAQLNQSNAELRAFTYSVSHDLRAPLRGIDGWSLALMEDCAEQLDERGREYLARVRDETQRMGRLIDDLLRLSRITHAEVRRTNVDLSGIAGGILARLRDESPARHVECMIEPGMMAEGDPGLLRAALTNLLENAWKFTGKREEARIEFGKQDRDGKRIFFVRDNGAGFDMAYASKLFAPFQRVHKYTEFPGTGIGLATVQRIIHRHRGRVWVEAEPNRGATFFFTLEAPV